jgi:hypothetical protein
MIVNSTRNLLIRDFLFKNGYGWVKQSNPRVEWYVRDEILIVLTYKMLKFYVYDRDSKKPKLPICQLSKNLDEMLWKKLCVDLIDHSVEESFDMLLDEIEKNIEMSRTLQR